MTSKERVAMVIAHEEPDRVPICATYTPEIEEKLRAKYHPEGDLGVALGNDMVKIASGLENSFYYKDTPEYLCPYGITWRNVKNETGHFTEIVKHPLQTEEDIYNYQMPKAADAQDVIEATRKANQMAQKIIEDFGLPIKATTKVKDLSIAYQQMVEIMKAYSRDNLKVICFDEPTASLSDAEIDSLFGIIRKLKAEGKIIIYVSHRMSEIRTIADKVAIFKDGRYVDTVDAKTTPENEMIRMMVGRNLGDIYANLSRNDNIGEELLRVERISSDYVKEVSFTLHKGEVLGFSGLVGAGRTEAMRAIIGADKMLTGEVYLEGKKLKIRSPYDAMKHGIVLVPEDRKLQGILSNLDITGNINISLLDQHANKLGVIRRKDELETAEKSIQDFRIKTPSADKKIVELSGGNQQKCIVARWMATNPKVLILDEPTKGIDVGAKAEFYQMICDFAKQGLGVILISSELPEVIGLSDRIIVMRGKEIAGEVLRADATEDRLLSLGMIEKDSANKVEERA